MTLSIIILNYKSKNLTRECVRSVLDSKLPDEYEIIVVDNGSNDGVKNMLDEQFGGKIKFIGLEKNVGMGAGNNAGIKTSVGKYVMILNPDGIVLENSILELIEFAEKNPKAGIIAPKIINPDGTHQVSVHKFPNFLMPFYRRTFLGKTNRGKEYLEKYVVDTIPQDRPSLVDWVFGPAFLARRDLIDAIGGYDERFFLFFEDTDLCRRVHEYGLGVWYVPSSNVIHFPHRLSGHHLGLMSLRKKTTWHHIVSWLKYFWKWRNSPFSPNK